MFRGRFSGHLLGRNMSSGSGIMSVGKRIMSVGRGTGTILPRKLCAIHAWRPNNGVRTHKKGGVQLWRLVISAAFATAVLVRLPASPSSAGACQQLPSAFYKTQD